MELKEPLRHPGSEATDSSYYRLDVTRLIRQLRSDGSRGLNQAEAARRLREQGANELKSIERISRWSIFLTQFENVLIVILLVATAHD